MQNITYLLKYPHLYQIGKSHYVSVLVFPAIVHPQQQTLGQAATIPQKTKEVKKKKKEDHNVTAIYNSDKML